MKGGGVMGDESGESMEPMGEPPSTTRKTG